MKHIINLKFFCKLLDVNENEIPVFIKNTINEINFDYEVLTYTEQNKIINEIENEILQGNFSICGPHRDDLWERCWNEQLEIFTKSNYDLQYLVPKFIYSGKPVRFKNNFIKTYNEEFEKQYIDVCRLLIFNKYFSKYENIFEFGCGSGYNLIRISDVFPEKNIFGLDWSDSSVNLVNSFSQFNNLKIKGHNFDFFNPNYKIKIPPSSLIFTQTALEQVGTKYDAFLDYIMKYKPDLCVHIEPINELYEEKIPYDKVAIDYLLNRNYLNNFFTRIKKLERENKADIIEVKRIYSGGYYHESSLLVWKPLV